MKSFHFVEEQHWKKISRLVVYSKVFKMKPGDEIRTKPRRARKMQKKAQGHDVAERMESSTDGRHPCYAEPIEGREHTG